jgi:conjugative transposon TraN protein
MKKVLVGVFVIVLSVFAVRRSYAAQCRDSGNVVERTIGISYYKTTLILFPCAVKPVDVGSGEILAEKVDGFENGIKIKAGVECFRPTNFTAVTTDGRAYVFNLLYEPDPMSLIVDLRNGTNEGKGLELSPGEKNELAIDSTIDTISRQKRFLRKPRLSNEKVRLSLSGIYYRAGFVYVQVKISNDSQLPFEIDFTRSSIRDVKRMKRVAIQSEELTPYVTQNPHNIIFPSESSVLVFAYQQFSITKEKEFHLEIFEKRGGRHLILQVCAKKMRRVRPI